MSDLENETEPTAASRLRGWVLPGVLALLVLALLTTSFVVANSRGQKTDPGMLVAARQQARNFFTLDYRHPDADVDRVLALATGKFKREYTESRDALVKGIKDKKLVVTAAIPADGVAVEFVDGDHGRVLVAVDVTTGTAGATGTSVNRNRARLFLDKVDGRWLVSNLNQVG